MAFADKTFTARALLLLSFRRFAPFLSSRALLNRARARKPATWQRVHLGHRETTKEATRDVRSRTRHRELNSAVAEATLGARLTTRGRAGGGRRAARGASTIRNVETSPRVRSLFIDTYSLALPLSSRSRVNTVLTWWLDGNGWIRFSDVTAGWCRTVERTFRRFFISSLTNKNGKTVYLEFSRKSIRRAKSRHVQQLLRERISLTVYVCNLPGTGGFASRLLTVVYQC